MKVELIFEGQCPNIEAARRRLAEAMRDAGLPPQWTEWDQADASSPEFTRRFGSPTILVDGKDVAGGLPGESAGSCRLYRGVHGMEGAPATATIASALMAAKA